MTLFELYMDHCFVVVLCVHWVRSEVLWLIISDDVKGKWIWIAHFKYLQIAALYAITVPDIIYFVHLSIFTLHSFAHPFFVLYTVWDFGCASDFGMFQIEQVTACMRLGDSNDPHPRPPSPTIRIGLRQGLMTQKPKKSKKFWNCFQNRLFLGQISLKYCFT